MRACVCVCVCMHVCMYTPIRLMYEHAYARIGFLGNVAANAFFDKKIEYWRIEYCRRDKHAHCTKP